MSRDSDKIEFSHGTMLFSLRIEIIIINVVLSNFLHSRDVLERILMSDLELALNVIGPAVLSQDMSEPMQ